MTTFSKEVAQPVQCGMHMHLKSNRGFTNADAAACSNFESLNARAHAKHAHQLESAAHVHRGVHRAGSTVLSTQYQRS